LGLFYLNQFCWCDSADHRSRASLARVDK